MQKIQIRNNSFKTWIEINTSALKNNYHFFRDLAGTNCLVMAVVKSNAYGHGGLEVAKILNNFEKALQTADYKLQAKPWFGVDNIEEALVLRKEKIQNPILVLGWTQPQDFEKAAENNIALTISNFESINALLRKSHVRNKNRTLLKTHLKIDTGMHRQGFLFSDLPKLIKCCLDDPTAKKNIEGVYTHFSSAEDIKNPQVTKKQIEEFKKALQMFEKNGINPKIRHCTNTAAALLFPESYFDMIRIGIGIYGLYSSKEIKYGHPTSVLRTSDVRIKPALSWKTIISEIKNLPKGSPIGYDLTESLKRDSKIAIIPVGYWHGVPRVLSGIGYVLVNGKRAKILGNISMNMTAIDITGITAKVGDEAILIGKSGNAEISADELAELAGTINYEIITRINPLIKRVYL